MSRGYRGFQADAEQGVVTCPRCHEVFVPLDAPGWSIRALELPDGFPVLSQQQIDDRVEKLAPETERLLTALRQHVSDSTFLVWLAPLRLVGAAGDTLYALAPAEIVTWVRDRFAGILNETASALASRSVRVVVGGTA